MRNVFDQRKRQGTLLLFDKATLVMVMLGLVAASLLLSSFNGVADGQHLHILIAKAAPILVTNGSARWDNDISVTAPTFPFSLPTAEDVTVSPLFTKYYQRYSVTLGDPLTVAFPIGQGWIQFFTNGALLLPSTQAVQVRDAAEVLPQLIADGVKDRTTGVVRLSLLQGLLNVGSLAPLVGDDGETLTYADLRSATSAKLLQPAPANALTSLQGAGKRQRVFVQGGTQAGAPVGHYIPPAIWNYIRSGDVSPDGWMTDFGLPLTEALPFTATINGRTHHFVVQLFARDSALIDEDTIDDGQPIIEPLATGLAYLHTLNIPDVLVKVQQAVWTLGQMTLLASPDASQPLAHVGRNFPLTLLGDTTWRRGMLWYRVQWTTPKGANSGWVKTTDITFTDPGQQVVTASFDAISPALASYLAGIGPDIGVVLYDVTHQRYYTYNGDASFVVASSMKVPIMLTFLDQLEQQGLEPDSDQMSLLTTMIENSNNDSASELYYNEIGGPAGITNYLQRIGVTGIDPNGDAWGYSTITPQAMVALLTMLDEGMILNANDRALAFNLMENIQPDQQIGVGTTAPAGATVAMKDGWVSEDDNLWAMNSSGIITAGQETYILAVYTQEQPTLDDGQAIVTQVCSTVTTLFS